MMKSKLMKSNLLLALVTGLSASGLYAQTCYRATTPATTPTERFTSDIEGTASDSITKLMWKKCIEGQAYHNETCSGTSLALPWVDAIEFANSSTFAGFTDWRLPNIKELASIIERQCYDPALNLDVFPMADTDRGFYPGSHRIWSSTPKYEADDQQIRSSYYVDLSAGHTDTYSLGAYSDARFRLVRDITD